MIDVSLLVSVDHYHWVQTAVSELFVHSRCALYTVAEGEGQQEFYGQTFHCRYSGKVLGTSCPSTVLGSQAAAQKHE